MCGVRVEDVEDPLMQKIRYLDKLIDELAKGKVHGQDPAGLIVTRGLGAPMRDPVSLCPCVKRQSILHRP